MSAVALDVDSGKLKWHFQYLPNDAWDYDTTAEHHIIDVVRNGQTHKAVVQANKLGYVYTLDRVTGQFLSAVPFIKSLNWGGPDPATGKVSENAGRRPTMGGPPVEVCPSLLGGTGWQPKVFNPKTGYLYIPANEFCMRYAYVADLTYKRGQLFTGVTAEHFSRAEQAGVLRAFDVNQNKVVWEWSNRTPLISHTLSTAGNLVFQGIAQAGAVDGDQQKVCLAGKMLCRGFPNLRCRGEMDEAVGDVHRRTGERAGLLGLPPQCSRADLVDGCGQVRPR